MSAKKPDFTSALRATTTQQKAVIEDRFSRADSVFLNPASGASVDPVSPVPKELVTRDTFSMPAEEHAIIERLRLIAAKEDVLVNKSEIVRCSLLLLAEVNSDELLKRLGSLKKGRPGRR
jgi:hypothetical protein